MKTKITMNFFKLGTINIVLFFLLISCKEGLITPKGTISGTIDAYSEYSENLIGNSGFTIVLSDGKKEWKTQSTEDSKFEFLNIPQGTYTISGYKEGFEFHDFNYVISHVGGEIATPAYLIFYEKAKTHRINDLDIKIEKQSYSDYVVTFDGNIEPAIPKGKLCNFSLFGSLDEKVDTSSTYIMNIDAQFIIKNSRLSNYEISKFITDNNVKNRYVYFVLYQNPFSFFTQNTKPTFPLINPNGSNIVKVFIE